MSCCRIAALKRKEVVNSKNGCRLGCVDDVEIDTINARLISIIIYGRPKFFGLFGRRDDMVISWNDIELVGEDAILVSNCPPPKRVSSIFSIPFFR